MKKLLIASTALLALAACTAPVTETDPIADLAKTIEGAKDVETLQKAEAEATKMAEGAIELKNKASTAVGTLFLEKNASKPDVVTTESGLQYKVSQAGIENGAKAAPGQGIEAHYHGYFINGDVFDSSYQRGRPLAGPSNAFISGWNEALGEMTVCEARTLYINSDLAYGDRGRGGIPGGATLLFNMQLLSVQKTDDAAEGVFKCPDDKILANPEAY